MAALAPLLVAPEGSPTDPPVLPTPVRQRLLNLVNTEPGINKTSLCGRLGVAWGTVAYHVEVLACAGLIEVKPEGREANLFPRGLADSRRRLLLALRAPDAQLVLGAVGAVRQSSLLELSRRIGLSRKVVRRHLAQLQAAGLVQDKGTRRPRYALAEAVRPQQSLPFLAFGPHPLEAPAVH